MLFHIAIIDDNVIFTNYLQYVLQKSPHVEKINIFNSAEGFLYPWQGDNYNLLFVDIGLPAKNGIELVKTINNIAHNIQIVFITAHPEYAAEALQLRACAYLLKPVSEESILYTLDQIKESNLPDIRPRQPVQDNKKLYLRFGGDYKIITQKDIIFIEKQGKNCIFHTVSEKVHFSGTLESIEKNLDNVLFFKSHRSYIINLDMISTIQKWADRAYKIRMNNTVEEPLLSRSKIKVLKAILQFLSR